MPEFSTRLRRRKVFYRRKVILICLESPTTESIARSCRKPEDKSKKQYLLWLHSLPPPSWKSQIRAGWITEMKEVNHFD